MMNVCLIVYLHPSMKKYLLRFRMRLICLFFSRSSMKTTKVHMQSIAFTPSWKCTNESFERTINRSVVRVRELIYHIFPFNNHSTIIVPRLLLLLITFFLSPLILLTRGQMYQSLVYLTNLGMTFVPANPIEYLDVISNVGDIKKCFEYCNLKVLCRTFVYDSGEMVCTHYEDPIETGSIVPSTSAVMTVGGIVYAVNLFNNYGATCDKCYFDRYLQCSHVSLCACPIHSFFNGSICRNQVYYAQACSTADSCRQDLRLQCFIGICQCSLGTAWNETECVISKKKVFLHFYFSLHR